MVDGEPREADVFLHHAEGHRVPVLVRCAPLRDAGGAIVGAVETFSSELGVRAAREQLSELRRAARTDALTGVGNRAHVQGRLRALVAEHAERPGEAAVLMADVDRFKRVNDTYGHEVGDRVLRMVASTLRTNVRTSDTVGRWGGEEFVVLLGGVHEAGALRRVADKLRSLVATSRLDVGGDGVSVTLSLGATFLRADDTPASVVARADQAMYDSKGAGRNRVTLD
jgi:diguanylate cyclase (GGDEF)-like protein